MGYNFGGVAGQSSINCFRCFTGAAPGHNIVAARTSRIEGAH